MSRAWVFVFVTLVGTVAGQMLLKFAVGRRGAIPAVPGQAAGYLVRALLDPVVLFALSLAFVGAVAWIAALSKLPMSQAYPFMSMAFVATTLISALALGESVSALRWGGIGLVVLGLVAVARG